MTLKKEIGLKIVRSLALLAGLFVLGLSPVASANIVLTVDVSDTSAVVFSSTGADPLIDDSTGTLLGGVQLFDFFASNFNISSNRTLSGDLATLNSDPFNRVINGNILGFTNLSIFDSGSSFSSPLQISTIAPAFTGSATVNLSGANFLIGTVGDIRVAPFAGGSGAVIGQFQIVPEPSTLALTSMALVGLGITTARRQRQNQA